MFCCLLAICISDFFASIGAAIGERALGFFHLITGAWLMYLRSAATDIAGWSDLRQ